MNSMSCAKSILLLLAVTLILGVERQASAEPWGPWFYPTVERATTTADVVFIASLGDDSWIAPHVMKGYHDTVVRGSNLGPIHFYCREQLPAKAFQQLRAFRLVIFASFKTCEETPSSVWIMPVDRDLGSVESVVSLGRSREAGNKIACVAKDNSGKVVLNSTEIEQLIRCVIASHEESSGGVSFLTTTRCQTYFPGRPDVILNHRVEGWLQSKEPPAIPEEYRDLDTKQFGVGSRVFSVTNASPRYIDPLLAMSRSGEPEDRIYASVRLRRYSREFLRYHAEMGDAGSKWHAIRTALLRLAEQDPYQLDTLPVDGEESGADGEAYYPVRVAALSSLVHLGVVDASQEADLNEKIHFDEWIERESSGLLTIDVERLERDWGLQPLRTVCKAPPVPSGESKSPDPQDRREHYPWLLVLATILSAVVGYKVGVYSRRK